MTQLLNLILMPHADERPITTYIGNLFTGSHGQLQKNITLTSTLKPCIECSTVVQNR